MDIEISVIILTYNHQDYIEQAIQAVLNQTTSFDFEIIVSDDSSSDNTLEIVRKIAKDNQKIRIIEHKINVGTSQNLCHAIESSNAKYITYFGGDDYWIDETKLQKQFDIMESETGISAVCNQIIAINKTKVIRTYPDQILERKGVTLSLFLKGFFFPTSGILFQNLSFQKDWEKYRNFICLNRLVEDLPLSLLLLQLGKIKLIQSEMSVYRLRLGDENSNNYNSIVGFRKSFHDHIKLYDDINLIYTDLNFGNLKLIKLNEYFFHCLSHNKIVQFFEDFNSLDIATKVSFFILFPIQFIKALYNKLKVGLLGGIK